MKYIKKDILRLIFLSQLSDSQAPIARTTLYKNVRNFLKEHNLRILPGMLFPTLEDDLRSDGAVSMERTGSEVVTRRYQLYFEITEKGKRELEIGREKLAAVLENSAPETGTQPEQVSHAKTNANAALPMALAKHGILKLLSVASKEWCSHTDIRKLEYYTVDKSLLFGYETRQRDIKITNPYKTSWRSINSALEQLEQEGHIEKQKVEATLHGHGKRYKITDAGRIHLQEIETGSRNPVQEQRQS